MSTSDRLARILASSPELASFSRWLEAQRRTVLAGSGSASALASAADRPLRDYLFLEGRPRFEPRRDDVAVVAPGLSVTSKGKEAVVIFATAGAPPISLAVPGVQPRSVERLLAAIDGQRTLLEARWIAELPVDAAARILRATFGLVVFAPGAVSDLESRLSSVEIVRYPTSPYAVERTYWHNAADVRERAVTLRGELTRDVSSFVAALRELHVLQILGASLDSFYRPASPSTDGGVDPGSFYLAPPRILERDGSAAVFLDGLRVLAPAVGGTRAFAALCASVGDAEAARGPREIVDAGVAWGRVTLARGDGDDAAKLWFIPPRPIQDEHWAALCDALREAHAAPDRVTAIAAAARFHARFVRLHPFRCANQSIAMNLANQVVARVAGCGIPHLALDHLALRLAPAAYEEAFLRAVNVYAIDAPNSASHLTTVRSRSRAALGFCDSLDALSTDADVAAAIAARPEVAAWSLVVP